MSLVPFLMRPFGAFLLAVVLTVLVAVFSWPAAGQEVPPGHPPVVRQNTGPVCGTRTALAKQLENKYSEQAVSMGLASTGAVVEVYASETGTWTMLLTMPNGVTCILAAGEHWEAVEKKRKSGFIPSGEQHTVERWKAGDSATIGFWCVTEFAAVAMVDGLKVSKEAFKQAYQSQRRIGGCIYQNQDYSVVLKRRIARFSSFAGLGELWLTVGGNYVILRDKRSRREAL